MIYVFVDTEFTQLDRATMKLISVGLCAEYPIAENSMRLASYYVELHGEYTLEDCSQFVKDNVLIHLEGKNVAGRHTVLLQVAEFIEQIPDDVVLVSDAPSWDFPHFDDLLNVEGFRPKNLVALGCFRTDQKVPEENYFRTHHALDDAIINLLCAKQNKKAHGSEGGDEHWHSGVFIVRNFERS